MITIGSGGQLRGGGERSAAAMGAGQDAQIVEIEDQRRRGPGTGRPRRRRRRRRERARKLGQRRRVHLVVFLVRRRSGHHLALPLSVLPQRRRGLPHPLRHHVRLHRTAALLFGNVFRTVRQSGTRQHLEHLSALSG